MSVSDGASESLRDILGEIPDRRGRKGRGTPAFVAFGSGSDACGEAVGANDPLAVYRRGRRLPEDALSEPGLSEAPRHATYRYFFKAPDVDAAERAPGSWACGSDAPGHDGGKGVRPVSAFAGRPGAVIGRLRVSPEGNEATAVPALPRRLPLKGAIITGDAFPP